MAASSSIFRPSNSTRTLVCVNKVIAHDPTGTFFNPYMNGERKFTGIINLIDQMDAFFDQQGFPQAFNQYRSFQKTSSNRSNQAEEVVEQMGEEMFEIKRGEKATFVIQVQFRQNSTWQGTITWTEQKKIQHFRSTLEMIKLMDSALAAAQGNQEFADWMEQG